MNEAPEITAPTPVLSADQTGPLRGRCAGLRASSVRDGSAVIVAVVGELDASNNGSWSRLLTKMGGTTVAPGPFVVDVRGLRSMECGAFHILAREAQRCRRRGFNLCLVSNSPATAQTVAACGLRPVLLIFPTVDAALSRAGAPDCRNKHLTLVRQ
jgi:anti-anti-sigma factor